MQLAEEKGVIMHSPGPWVIKPDYGKENVYRLWDENGNYCDDTSPEAMDANAALFSAAPEMLDVLKDAIHDGRLQTFEDRERFRKAALVAIAKAKGGGQSHATR